MKYIFLFCCMVNQETFATPKHGWSKESSSFISTGQPAGQGKYPSFAWILNYGFVACEGTIIDRQTIMTEVVCAKFNYLRGTVAVGKYKSNEDEGTEQYFNITHYTRHKNYRFPYNNIALLHLNGTITYNEFVQPATLAKSSRMENTSVCFAVGAGTTSHGNDDVESPLTLHELQLNVISRKRCKRTVSRVMDMPANYVNKNMVCTFDKKVESCIGNIGSPLGCFDADGTFVQVGLLSYGTYNCTKGFGVYTRVSKYKKWIAANK